MLKMIRIFLLSIIFSSTVFANKALTDTVYITFQESLINKSVTINFHSEGKFKQSEVFFDEVSRASEVSKYAKSTTGWVSSLKDIKKTFHHVKLNNLTPGKTYYFVYGSKETGYSKEHTFRTVPLTKKKVKIITGGDMGPNTEFRPIAERALSKDPDLILLGGDISYANGKYSKVHRWWDWFKHMQPVMVTKEKRVIPLILAIGNHEVSTGMYSPKGKAPFFKTFFPQEEGTYFHRVLNNDNVLFVLDSGHMAPVDGEQKAWLEQMLGKFKGAPNKLALYHVPMYPSHRSYEKSYIEKQRKAWEPLFSKHNLTLAFENHDHALKRTKVLKNNKASSKGTLYVGDGCFGQGSRSVSIQPYLQVSKSKQHVWYVEADRSEILLEASGANNEVFDSVSLINTPTKTIVTKKLN